MKIFSFSCALGVAVTAWGMVAFGPESGFAAGKLHLPGSADLVRKSAEPFGTFAFRPSGSELREKMAGCPAQVRRRAGAIGALRRGPGTLLIPGGASILVDKAKSRQARARLGEINRAINLAIQPMSDLAI